MVETAPVTQPCAAGYSGWLGVTPKGVHDGSPVSAGLPPPARMAVTGRQKLNENLASQQPMSESANPDHSMAIKRAVWAVSNFCSLANLTPPKQRARWPSCGQDSPTRSSAA